MNNYYFRNGATDLVEQKLLYVGSEDGKLLAFRQIVQEGLKPPVLSKKIYIYFCQSFFYHFVN